MRTDFGHYMNDKHQQFIYMANYLIYLGIALIILVFVARLSRDPFLRASGEIGRFGLVVLVVYQIFRIVEQIISMGGK